MAKTVCVCACVMWSVCVIIELCVMRCSRIFYISHVVFTRHCCNTRRLTAQVVENKQKSSFNHQHTKQSSCHKNLENWPTCTNVWHLYLVVLVLKFWQSINISNSSIFGELRRILQKNSVSQTKCLLWNFHTHYQLITSILLDTKSNQTQFV